MIGHCGICGYEIDENENWTEDNCLICEHCSQIEEADSYDF